MPYTAPVDVHASPIHVARALIGTTLLADGVGGRIVETEADDWRFGLMGSRFVSRPFA